MNQQTELQNRKFLFRGLKWNPKFYKISKSLLELQQTPKSKTIIIIKTIKKYIHQESETQIYRHTEVAYNQFSYMRK